MYDAKKVDVWGAGVVLYCLLYRQARRAAAVVDARRADVADALSQQLPRLARWEVPAQCERCLRCLPPWALHARLARACVPALACLASSSSPTCLRALSPHPVHTQQLPYEPSRPDLFGDEDERRRPPPEGVIVDPGAEQLLDQLLARDPLQRPTTAQARRVHARGPLPPGARAGCLRSSPAQQPASGLCAHSRRLLVSTPHPCCPAPPAQIMAHPWFLQGLPEGALGLNADLLCRVQDDPTLADR